MTRYKEILLATDYSEPSRKALAEAVRMARKHQARLHVLHVDIVALQQTDGFEQPPLADYVRSMDQVALDAVGKDNGVSHRDTVTAVIRDSSEAAGILRYAAEKDIDLIVMGTRGRGAISELFIGSVAQEVAREALIPVLVVSANAQHTAPEGRPVILAPVDLSARSGMALAQAAALAQERDAHLVALNVLDYGRTTRDPALSPEKEEEQARDGLEAFVARALLPVDAEPLLGKGESAEVICDMARRRHASLIVIAASAHGPVDRLLLGSVSKQVIRKATCPVLIHRERIVNVRKDGEPSRVAA